MASNFTSKPSKIGTNRMGRLYVNFIARRQRSTNIQIRKQSDLEVSWTAKIQSSFIKTLVKNRKNYRYRYDDKFPMLSIKISIQNISFQTLKFKRKKPFPRRKNQKLPME